MASKSKRRRRVLGASCILAALIVAGSSFAWFTSKDEVTNRLTANSNYGVSIVESFVPPKQWVPGQEINKDVYAVNTGNIDAFVKESISANMTYTYEKRVSEAPEAGADEGYVKLDETAIRAIDGATTMEAGGFIAWAAPVKTIYKLNGTEATVTTEALANGKIKKETLAVKVDGAASTTDYAYQYMVGDETYVGQSLNEGEIFYKVTSNAIDTKAAGSLKLTVDYTPTAGPVNSATLTDVAQSTGENPINNPGQVIGDRWHPTETGVYIFRRSYVPDNAVDADERAFTYTLGTTVVSKDDFESDENGYIVTDEVTGTNSKAGTYKYKYTDKSSNVYFGNDLKDGEVFYKQTSTVNQINSGANDNTTFNVAQDDYYTYAGYYYVADATDPVKNEGTYYKIVLGKDAFRTYKDAQNNDVFDVSATEYDLGSGATITVDDKTGAITDGTVTFSYVKEVERKNVTPILTYHTEHSDKGVAYLQAYTAAGDTDESADFLTKQALAEAAATATESAYQTYLDKQGNQALAEALYDNAVGQYNSAVSRFKQAEADRAYAVALSKASSDIIDAAEDRAEAQAAYDKAEDEFNASFAAVQKRAKDLRGNIDTQPAASSPVGSSTTDFKDIMFFDANTDISYKSLFQTDGNQAVNDKTLEEIINDANADITHGLIPNTQVLTDAKRYMDGMKALWQDADTATDASIVGAVNRLWEALRKFNDLTKDSPNGADVDATDYLAELKAARTNLETLLNRYKAYYQEIATAALTEEHLTQLVNGAEIAGVEGKINAWLTRLSELKTAIEKEDNKDKIGKLTIDQTGTVTGDVGFESIVKDFVIKFNNFVQQKDKELPKAKDNWAKAVNDYNDAVNGTDGAKAKYVAAIQTDQRVRDPLHDKKNADGTVAANGYAWQKNDYEGIVVSTEDVVGTEKNSTDKQWWLTNYNDKLVETYAVMRPDSGTNRDPALGSTYVNTDKSLTTDGEDLWKDIGMNSSGTAPTVAMPTADADGGSNYTYYGQASGVNPAGTAHAVYTHTAGSDATYTKAIIAVTKPDTTTEGDAWKTLKNETSIGGTAGTPKHETYAQLKSAMDGLKDPAETKTTEYETAIANTAAAKAAYNKANGISSAAAEDAAAAAAADTSAIIVNIFLDDKDSELDWTSALADGQSAEVAEFYYNYILKAGETSEKLIDSVELDPSVTAKDYKTLVFDLNVALDSAQITYADDQRTITSTAVQAPAFNKSATVGRENPNGKGVDVTWTANDYEAPNTIYRVGTEVVEPKDVDTIHTQKTVTNNAALNGKYNYYIIKGSKTYFGKDKNDGTKYYYFGSGEDAIDANDSITLNIVE